MVTLVAAVSTVEVAGLPAVRYAGTAGRQLHALARSLPLAPGEAGDVGVYHALGDEKAAMTARGITRIVAAGFDSLKPAAIVFEYSAQGPFAQLAITHNLSGPFHILEAGDESGALALVTAAGDLVRGRCARALVGGFTIEPARAWLMLLAPGHVRVRWSRAPVVAAMDPADPLGLAAIAAALRAPPTRLTAGAVHLELGGPD